MTFNMKFMMLTTNQVVCITFLNWQRALLGLIFTKRYCNSLFVFFIIIEVGSIYENTKYAIRLCVIEVELMFPTW